MLGRQAIFLIVLGAAAALAAGSRPVVASERLSLPFKCSVQGGNIRLVPAGEQTLAIAGVRQERVVLACAEGSPVQCRTMIAHNFAVMCGGERVSWMRVAEAIGGRRASRVWREGEQLNITLREDDPDGAVASSAPCVAQQSGALPSGAAQGGNVPPGTALEKPCRTTTARELHFTLPAGFAPVSHFGARIMAVAAPAAPTAGASETAAMVPRAPVLAAAARSDIATPATRQRILERTILSEPLPDIDAGRAQPQQTVKDRHDGRPLDGNEDLAARAGATVAQGLAEGGSASSTSGKRLATLGDAPQRVISAWNATVTPRGASNPVDVERTATFSAALSEQVSTTQRDVMLWFVLTSLFVTTGWMMWSRPERFAFLARRVSIGAFEGLLQKAPAMWATSGLFMHATRSLASLWPAGLISGKPSGGGGFPAAGLDAAYGGVCSVVGALPTNLPLRSVLDDEIQRVCQRLAVAKAASEDGLIPAAAFRVLMRDLERIRRIGESARESVAANARTTGVSGAASGHMPRNRAEAFELLGLNASVSDATIKKCVDALRMSWHPDLAHDAADLALREERIKQINAAMDLISRKPQQD